MHDNSETQQEDFPEGLPIYDRNGEELGVVSSAGRQEQYLIMKEGLFFHRDVAVPASAIARSDEDGIYLNRTRQEIHDLTLGGWSSLGTVDLDSGTPASARPVDTSAAPQSEAPAPPENG
jgi:hypothetical protein